MNMPEGISGGILLCDQWLQLLEELNIAAFTVDADRCVRSVNHSAQALMDFKDSEVLGRDCRDIFSRLAPGAKSAPRLGLDRDRRGSGGWFVCTVGADTHPAAG